MPSTTFLFCVESGYFEGQTVLAIECLRRFGERLADAPVLVVTPRYGPSLAHDTLRSLEKLGAKYLHKDMKSEWAWYPYMNKGFAAQLADEYVETQQIVWLDSDVLVIGEPSCLILSDDEDFTCCAVDKNVGTSGPADPNEAYWSALAGHFRVPIDCLPWVQTEHDNARVRLRLHSGVYSFRRGAGLGKTFANDIQSMLASKISYSRELPQPGDDVALAFSVVRLNLRWRLLPMSHNYEMTPSSSIYRRDSARMAKILHFHHALSSEDESKWFLDELQQFRPDVSDWLRARVPLPRRAGGIRELLTRRILRERRSMQQTKHIKSCRFMVQS